MWSWASTRCTFVPGGAARPGLGLALNSLLGWWWADPMVALVIGVVAVREGWQAWRGEHCACC
jgi:hypothetical protein